MNESELKKVLELLKIDWSAFAKFISNKTVMDLGTESYYYLSDIDFFLMTYLQENISKRPQF